MARTHRIAPTVPTKASFTVRLGASNNAAGRYDDNELGKIVKLAGESRYVLAAVGDPIEGFITSIEMASQDGWSIGGFTDNQLQWVCADGLQATPGVGVIVVGDYVLVGTPQAKGTKTLEGFPRVVSATNQATAKAGPFAWRVESLGPVGTGAVGTQICIRKVM